tara:strand:- start:1966 stop:2100 length:135 start_codon:yes stop_codon:yes gene_type:complete
LEENVDEEEAAKAKKAAKKPDVLARRVKAERVRKDHLMHTSNLC